MQNLLLLLIELKTRTALCGAGALEIITKDRAKSNLLSAIYMTFHVLFIWFLDKTQILF